MGFLGSIGRMFSKESSEEVIEEENATMKRIKVLKERINQLIIQVRAASTQGLELKDAGFVKRNIEHVIDKELKALKKEPLDTENIIPYPTPERAARAIQSRAKNVYNEYISKYKENWKLIAKSLDKAKSTNDRQEVIDELEDARRYADQLIAREREVIASEKALVEAAGPVTKEVIDAYVKRVRGIEELRKAS